MEATHVYLLTVDAGKCNCNKQTKEFVMFSCFCTLQCVWKISIEYTHVTHPSNIICTPSVALKDADIVTRGTLKELCGLYLGIKDGSDVMSVFNILGRIHI